MRGHAHEPIGDAYPFDGFVIIPLISVSDDFSGRSFVRPRSLDIGRVLLSPLCVEPCPFWIPSRASNSPALCSGRGSCPGVHARSPVGCTRLLVLPQIRQGQSHHSKQQQWDATRSARRRKGALLHCCCCLQARARPGKQGLLLAGQSHHRQARHTVAPHPHNRDREAATETTAAEPGGCAGQRPPPDIHHSGAISLACFYRCMRLPCLLLAVGVPRTKEEKQQRLLTSTCPGRGTGSKA